MSNMMIFTGNSNQTLADAISKYLEIPIGKAHVGTFSDGETLVETPLFRAVMEHCKYNQSRAAVMLGISRGTLRTKLKRYFDDKYVGSRD